MVKHIGSSLGQFDKPKSAKELAYPTPEENKMKKHGHTTLAIPTPI
jgi:hypothetical protein